MRERLDFGTSFLQVGAVLQPSSTVAESFFCTEGEFFQKQILSLEIYITLHQAMMIYH